MQKWQCPIHNSTLINNVEGMVVLTGFKMFISDHSYNSCFFFAFIELVHTDSAVKMHQLLM